MPVIVPILENALTITKIVIIKAINILYCPIVSPTILQAFTFFSFINPV